MKLVGKTKEQMDILYKNKLAAQIRMERDRRIAEIEWRRLRYYDQLALGLTPSESIEPILRYIQALRDITQQPGFPENIIWPEKP